MHVLYKHHNFALYYKKSTIMRKRTNIIILVWSAVGGHIIAIEEAH